MIKIEGFRSLGDHNFEVRYVDPDNFVQERQFRYSEEPVNGNGGPRLKLLGSADTFFHNYLAANPEFKRVLFRLAQAESEKSPISLPLALS